LPFISRVRKINGHGEYYHLYEARLFYDDEFLVARADMQSARRALQQYVDELSTLPLNEITAEDALAALEAAGVGGAAFEIEKDLSAELVELDPILQFRGYAIPVGGVGDGVIRIPPESEKKVPLPVITEPQPMEVDAIMRFSSRFGNLSELEVKVDFHDGMVIPASPAITEKAFVVLDENLSWKNETSRQVGMSLIASCNYAVQNLASVEPIAARNFLFALASVKAIAAKP
jgi:hypothetical protein